MYIESKLIEVDEALFSLDLSERIGKNIELREIVKNTYSWLKAESKIQFATGLFTVDTSFKNEKELTDIFTIRGEYIQVSYLGKGDSLLVFPGENQAIGLGGIQCCYDQDTVSTIKMPANKPTHYQGVFLSKEYYLKLLQNEDWVANDLFYQHVIKGDYLKWGSCKFPIDYSLYHILNEITQGNWEEAYRKYYLELRLKELFLSLHLCREEANKALSRGVSDENLEKIRTAHAYLIENFKNPLTIKVLARKVLLNELQLKKDFKIVYGTTIRSFIIDLRMEEAKSLLGKYTVSEMAEILGYKSVPHFINTFKKCYGYTPKQGLKQ